MENIFPRLSGKIGPFKWELNCLIIGLKESYQITFTKPWEGEMSHVERTTTL